MQNAIKNEVTESDKTASFVQQLEAAGFEYAVATATQAEIDAGAACGQLSIITDNK